MNLSNLGVLRADSVGIVGLLGVPTSDLESKTNVIERSFFIIDMKIE